MLSHKHLLTILILVVLSVCVFKVVYAQENKFTQEDRLTLTITPPLIKNNINPGESWASYIKVVNNNIKPIDVYTYVFDFKSAPDGGVEFIQQNLENALNFSEEDNQFLLSQWISIERGPIHLEPHESKKIPFSIRVPAGAEPGGHYAAILVGTKPVDKIKGTGIKISSMVSSLVMISVGGDIIERADIREFYTDKSLYSQPKVKFILRLENTGNVHIHPQGEIKIYNFWGKEVGSIPINHNTSFGNVLPKSIRKWEFDWDGEENLFDMGRFKATVVLTYGEGAKETVYKSLYFWIIYWRPVLVSLAILLIIILIIIISVKIYVKRAIKSVEKNIQLTKIEENKKEVSVIPSSENGVINLRSPKQKKRNK